MSKVHSVKSRNYIGNNGNMVCLGITYQANFGKSFQKGQKMLWNGGYDSGTVK